jgi:hypothetical protein
MNSHQLCSANYANELCSTFAARAAQQRVLLSSARCPAARAAQQRALPSSTSAAHLQRVPIMQMSFAARLQRALHSSTSAARLQRALHSSASAARLQRALHCSTSAAQIVKPLPWSS